MSGCLRITFILLSLASMGASHASRNFVVQAPTAEMARQVAEAAELHRRKLAVYWYGHEVKNWSEPCHVTVNVNEKVGASGATKFRFVNGEVLGWDMEVNGPFVRILDSVVPHEVNHTILACYFRRKVPRWADEGAATLMEHSSEQDRQIEHVEHLVDRGQRIPLRVLFGMTQYPSDGRQVMALYSQGYSVTEFLITQGGRERFLKFLDDAHRSSWDKAVQANYGEATIEKLEQQWTGWVMAGSGRAVTAPGQLLVSNPTSGDDGSVRAAGDAAALSGGQLVPGGQPAPRGRPAEAAGGMVVAGGTRPQSGGSVALLTSASTTSASTTSASTASASTASAAPIVRGQSPSDASAAGPEIVPTEMILADSRPSNSPAAVAARELAARETIARAVGSTPGRFEIGREAPDPRGGSQGATAGGLAAGRGAASSAVVFDNTPTRLISVRDQDRDLSTRNMNAAVARPAMASRSTGTPPGDAGLGDAGLGDAGLGDAGLGDAVAGETAPLRPLTLTRIYQAPTAGRERTPVAGVRVSAGVEPSRQTESAGVRRDSVDDTGYRRLRETRVRQEFAQESGSKDNQAWSRFPSRIR